MKQVVARLQLAFEISNAFGIRILWTRNKNFFIAYLQETNELLLNSKAFKDGRAREGNVEMLTHAIFHELAHAILWKTQMVPPSDQYLNIPEELWCDEFANEMCLKAGMKNPERFAAYIQEFI